MLAILLFCAAAVSVHSVEFGKNIAVMFDGFNSGQKDNIRSALREISSKTCLTFTEKSSARPPYVKFRFTRSPACYSFLGPQARGNDIMLSDYCTKRRNIVEKEFMHALGFINEHNRSDRDDYVTINFNDIPASTRHNFRKSRPGSMNEKTDYDYRSVLHYRRNAFSLRGRDTIVTKDSSFQNVIGNGQGLSALDADKIKLNFCA